MKIVKKEDWWEESKKFSKTKNEEFLDIDDTLAEIEKSSNVIRLEMNTIELPLFSKNPKRIKNEIKVYHFKTDKSSFLEIEAPAGFAIPGEFEEKVFIALTRIMKKNNYSRKFIVSVNEILENLGLKNPIYYKKIKDSLVLLSKTNYTFFNSLYSNIDSGVLNKEVVASIMNVTIITRKDESYKNIEAFEDGRVREVYEIVLSDYFYNNIITKGYMAFDAEKLLSIENSIARSIFTMVEKWRGYNLYLKRPVFFIARRVPLKWNKNQIKRTVDTIEKALIELKTSNLINNYRIIKEKKWELAEVEITFLEDHNKTKRETFFTEKNEFINFEMVVTDTEERIKESSKGDLNEILELFPKRVLEMKTFESFIKNSVEKYGFDYVIWTAEYTIIKKPTSYKSYLLKALENNWADEYIAKKKVKKEKNIDMENAIIIETENKQEKNFSWNEFEKLSIISQEELEKIAYNKYLCETNSIDNKITKGIFEKTKKGLIIKLYDEFLEIKKKDIFPSEHFNNDVENLSIEQNINNDFLTETHELEYRKLEMKKYPSLAKFTNELYLLVKQKNKEISLGDVASSLKIMEEYEDDYYYAKFDEETNLGGYSEKFVEKKGDS